MTATAFSDVSSLFGQDAWTRYLSTKTLPVRAGTLAQLQRALRQDSTTLVDLGHLIRRDPVLSLHVTRLAQQRHAQKGTAVTGIDHAIASIGFDQIETLSRELQVIRPHPHNVAQTNFFRAVSDSQHAAIQAAAWVQLKQLPYVEEARLAALFYGLVHWLLWLYAPLHKQQFQIEVIEHNASPVDVERRIFGCTTQELGKSLAETWQLTQLTQAALDHATSPSLTELKRLHLRAIKDPRLEQSDLRQLNHLVQQHYYPVKLANWMALTVGRGWHNPRAARMFDIITDYLGLSHHETQVLLHRLCAEASREYHVPGVMAPAAELLLIPSAQHLPYRLSEREIALYRKNLPHYQPHRPIPDPAPQQPPAAQVGEAEPHYEPPALLNPLIYEQISARLQHGYELYSQPAPILQGLLQAVHRGLGLERVALCLIQRREHRLRAVKALGFEHQHPLHTLEIDLETPGLFKRLAEKTACLWINADNRVQVSRALPADCRDWLLSHDSLLMSVADAEGPLALIYADRGNQSAALTEFHQQHFRSLCSGATLALKRLTGTTAR